MKVQKIVTDKGSRYLLLDDDYNVIEPVRKYLKYLDILNKSPNTLKSYAYHLKVYYEYLDILGIDLHNINCVKEKSALEILSDYIAWLQYPNYFNSTVVRLHPLPPVRNKKTINFMLTPVLGIYEYLANSNEIKHLSIYQDKKRSTKFKSFLYELVRNKDTVRKNVLKLTIDKNEDIEFITRDTYNEMFKLCTSYRDKAILGLMFECGLRLGEVRGLHIEDVEIWEGKILIKPRENLENDARVKNQAAGYQYMPDYLLDVLTNYILNELEQYDTEYLFVNLKGKNKGKPMKAITIQKLFERFSKRLQIKVNPHMCRHGYATEHLEAGEDIVHIQKALRHQQINTTDKYTHFTNKYKKEQVRKFYEAKKMKLGGVSVDDE